MNVRLRIAIAAGLLAAGPSLAADTPARPPAARSIRRIDPPQLAPPNGYSHVVETAGGRTLYVSGQVALDKSGAIVGKDDLRAQTQQVFENLKSALAAAGATLDDVVQIHVYMLDASDIKTFRQVRDRYFQRDPPASTLVQVVMLARPEFLIEIDAVAVAE